MSLFSKPKPVLVRIEVNNLVWEVAQDPESGAWIGLSRPLNLNAIGDTWAEFWQCANEAIALLFTDLLREGELATFLRDQGWQPSTPLPSPGTPVRWDVPFEVRKRARFEQLVPA